MRIVMDCRSLRKKPAGVPNFLISFINAFASLQPGHELWLVSNEAFHPENAKRINTLPNTKILISPLKPFGKIAIIWYLIKLPWLVGKIKPEYFYTPIPNLPLWLPSNVKTLITVHDMVFKQFPETMSSINWWINFFLHDHSIRKANRIWTVSDYTKKEVEQRFPHRAAPSIFAGSSIDKETFVPVTLSQTKRAEMLSRYQLGEKFILFVGTLEPRKNLAFLISLMPSLAEHGYSLLIVGSKGWGADQHAMPQNLPEGKVRFSGFVTTQELVKLYCVADVYVSTALNEGFGLPQLEAMSCGCPVVSPHNSAMIEVVEGAGETVKGWQAQQWIDTILKVSKERDRYILQGLERASQYDWGSLVKELMAYLH